MDDLSDTSRNNSEHRIILHIPELTTSVQPPQHSPPHDNVSSPRASSPALWTQQQSTSLEPLLLNSPMHPPVQWTSNHVSSPIIASQSRRASYKNPPEAQLTVDSPKPTHFPWQSSPVTTRPILPSPAPSDENVALPKRVASVSRQLRPSGRPSFETPVEHSTFSGAWTNRTQTQPASTLNPRLATVGSPPSHLTHHQQYHYIRPAQQIPATQVNHSRQTNGLMPQVVGNMPQGNVAQPPKSPQYSIPFNRMQLRNSVDSIAAQYQQQAQDQPCFLTGRGRLSLLREAIEQDDMFYLILSQLLCLRSMNAKTVPPVIQKLPQSCFNSLEQLLYANAGLGGGLLSYFASFPQPIEFFYTSPSIHGLRELYDSVVGAIAAFLGPLGQNLNLMMNESHSRQSPPLVHDMQLKLALFSPSLQSVVFRAISRKLLHGCRDEQIAISALEFLHREDLEMVRKCVVRSQQALQQSHNALRILIQQYRTYETDLTSNRNLPPFQISGELLVMFRGLSTQSTNGGVDQVMSHGNAMMHAGRPGILSSRTRIIMPRSSQARQQHGPTPVQSHHPPTHSIGASNVRAACFFFPRRDAPPPAILTDPQPARIGIHQSHLKSPVPGPRDVAVVPNVLYRQVSGFGFWPPWRLDPNLIKQSINFMVSTKDRERTSKTTFSTGDSAPLRTIDPHSLTWRLRCTQSVQFQHTLDDSTWLEADSIWPEDTYFFIGEDPQPLDLRKKLHYGRYLPIDLTTHIREGSNTITVVINRNSYNRSKPYDYALAIEKVEIISHQYILDRIPQLDYKKALEQITHSIGGNTTASNNDDDEVMIMTTSVNLNIRNPHTLLLINVPVRSSRCKHFDCFDLPTYLLSAKRDDPAWPSKVDTWRCPICRCDARPSLLLHDGFFARVRQDLQDRGELDVESIIVEANGHWRVKAREGPVGVRSASLEREEAERSTAGGNLPRKKQKEKEWVVIELDDD